MREIEVRVVSPEGADHVTVEFWLGGQLFGFTRLEEGELVSSQAVSAGGGETPPIAVKRASRAWPSGSR